MAVFIQKKCDARRCRAIVRAISTNHDGFKLEGLPYPDSQAQIRLLEGIYGSQIDPCEVTFLEAHGTGTPVGDPEELEAISEIFCRRSRGSPRSKPLLVGSVKSNLGHAETAAGLCGVAKVLSIFQSGVISPNLNYKTPNQKCPELVKGALKVSVICTPQGLRGRVHCNSSWPLLPGSFWQCFFRLNGRIGSSAS